MIDPTNFGQLAPKPLRYAFGTAALGYFGLRLAIAIIEQQGIMQFPSYAADAAMAAAIFLGILVGIWTFMQRGTNEETD